MFTIGRLMQKKSETKIQNSSTMSIFWLQLIISSRFAWYRPTLQSQVRIWVYFNRNNQHSIKIISILFWYTLVINKTAVKTNEINQLIQQIRLGGHWEPEHCLASQKLGIFIPLRGRWDHYSILLRHLHQLLISQQCHYTFYVIEQGGITKLKYDT